MNMIKIELVNGGHMMTSKHNDSVIDNLKRFIENSSHYFKLNDITFTTKNGKIFVGENQVKSVIVEKHIIQRKEFKCQT